MSNSHVTQTEVLDDDRLIVKWNLPALAAVLAAHLERLETTGDRWDDVLQSEEFLEPYRLAPDDEHTVIILAWNAQCCDCGDVWDHYMVYGEVWAAGGLKREEYCCRACLEVRLKRALGPEDFTLCPVNYEQGLVGSPE
jgi:hypothetical protein